MPHLFPFVLWFQYYCTICGLYLVFVVHKIVCSSFPFLCVLWLPDLYALLHVLSTLSLITLWINPLFMTENIFPFSSLPTQTPPGSASFGWSFGKRSNCNVNWTQCSKVKHHFGHSPGSYTLTQLVHVSGPSDTTPLFLLRVPNQ